MREAKGDCGSCLFLSHSRETGFCLVAEVSLAWGTACVGETQAQGQLENAQRFP